MTSKTFLKMNLISWLLSACNSSVPSEAAYFGYNLPVQKIDKIWENYEPLRIGQMQWATEGSVQFIAQDNFTNPKIFTFDGIGALDTVSNQLLWHTAFPEKILVSTFNKNDSSYISSKIGILNNNRLLYTYSHTVPRQANTDQTNTKTHWKYLILDSKSGEIIKQGGIENSDREAEYLFMANSWFLRNYTKKQISRLNPETGETIWTYNHILRDFASLTDQTVSFFNDNLDDTYQITVLDLATGKPIFEKVIEGFAKHKITNVLCRDDTVFVDMGAAYEINPLGAIRAKYMDYTVAFDLKTTKPLWRTVFVKN
jgi:outer membrane protein assembly factor BamB